MKFEIKRQLLQRTDRVKGVELHPTEPWLMANLYSGKVLIYNYTDATLVKSFEVTEQPVRAAKFVARKQWVVTGSDDMLIRVYNYNTMDKVKVFEAHTDYIRCIAVHPTLPVFLTSSDDTLIKLWDWDKGFACIQQFEGHSHFVMQVAFNPKDYNTFASASLDRSIKVWSLGQPLPNFTLEGHDKGVNCLDYFSGSDRPYLISGADDKLIKVWDYQTKACVQTLEGHSHNIAAVCLHPELPLIVSGSEDGTIRMWHSTTYRCESTLDYRMERVWGLGYLKGSNSIAIGYDDGTVMIKVGREEPVASMDSSGKIIWARHNEVQTVNIKALGADYEMQDGERLPLAVKDLGSSDLYPQSLQHNPNGRFVTVCGDGEYVVYTALAWRNKSFGQGLEFVWSNDSNEYAIRESAFKVKLYKNFQEKTTLKLDFSAEGIFGGSLVGVKSNDYIVFYDWEGKLVRRVDAVVRSVHWSEGGTQVAVVSDDSFYLLQYNTDVVDAAWAAGGSADPDGIDDAFELIAEINERVKAGVWVGDCFIYNTASWRLNYCVGGEVTTMYHLDRPMHLLGYLASLNRVFLVDKDFGIVSYTLLLSMVEFKILCMRGDVGSALVLLPQLPQDQLNNVARFLESKGHMQEALSVATDPEYKFDLAIQLGDLQAASSIAGELDAELKWRQLGELAMSAGQLSMAQQCLVKAKDYSGLLLMRSVMGERKGLADLATEARDAGKHNVAFLGLFLLGRMQECMQLLVEAGRLPEAAFFCRTYAPSLMTNVVSSWKADLAKQNPKAAESLADPAEYPNLFPNLHAAYKAEKWSMEQRAKNQATPTSKYLELASMPAINLVGSADSMFGEGHEANGADMEQSQHEADEEEVEGEEQEEDVQDELLEQQQEQEAKARQLQQQEALAKQQQQLQEEQWLRQQAEEQARQQEEDRLQQQQEEAWLRQLHEQHVKQQQEEERVRQQQEQRDEEESQEDEEEEAQPAPPPTFTQPPSAPAQKVDEEVDDEELFDTGDAFNGAEDLGAAGEDAQEEEDDWGFNEDDDKA